RSVTTFDLCAGPYRRLDRPRHRTVRQRRHHPPARDLCGCPAARGLAFRWSQASMCQSRSALHLPSLTILYILCIHFATSIYYVEAPMVAPTTAEKTIRVLPWNPITQLRILWWLLVVPARFEDFYDRAGEEATRQSIIWL